MNAGVKGKVLCVEDHLDDCDLVKQILDDFDVTCVSNIEEACGLLDQTEYCLVIIDEHLPDGSGLSLCGKISKKNSDTPVLISTADSYMTNAEAVRCGARALLTKSKVDYVDELKLFAGHYARS